MRGRRRWLGVVLVLLCGCAGGVLPEDVQLTPGFATPGTPYGQALRRFTRYAELYQGLDTVAKGWATWRTPELRRQEAEASIRAYDLRGGVAGSLLREQERAGRRGREFHLSLYTPEKDWNDLESPNTLWKPYLELAGGERLQPVRVIYLPKSGKSSIEYPYVNRWTREYSLLFPLLDGAESPEHLSLVLAGPLGTIRFEF